MDATEAIKIVDSIKSYAENAGWLPGIPKAMEMAKCALEKQVGREPVIVPNEFYKEPETEWFDYLCPVCKRTLISRCDGEWFCGRKVEHCECGQKIDWSVT